MSSITLCLILHFSAFLAFIPRVYCQSVEGASLFVGGGASGSGPYTLVDEYEPANFFNKFNYYNSYDPTYGHVQYVSETVAVQNGYVTTNEDNVVVSVDTTNKWPRGGSGRPSVRLISDNTYSHGLFILDLAHMPYGCGTWPAFWLLGPNWPYNGEIDIIEGVNTIADNTMTMHTSSDCTITGSGATSNFESPDCDVNDGNGCGFMSNNASNPYNYGEDLNSIGGGIYATEWTSGFVRIWFFPRYAIPYSITNFSPDVSQFGTPMALFQGSCNIDEHFNNHSIIINTDFCGAWAGNVYSQYGNCPQNASLSSIDACVDFVGDNPSAFTDAYWQINSIKVYQLPQGASTSSQISSTYLSTSSPASTVPNTVFEGMGQSTSPAPTSISYTGPLSTGSTTASVAAAETPAICPTSNGTTYIDANDQVYTIGCGSDFQAVTSGSSTFQSFEMCMETCDTWMGCTGVAYIGGNGAGTCYFKSGQGAFVYDGHTFGAIRVAGAAVGYSNTVPSTTGSTDITSTSVVGSSASTAIVFDQYSTTATSFMSISLSPSPSNSLLPTSTGPFSNLAGSETLGTTTLASTSTEALLYTADLSASIMTISTTTGVVSGGSNTSSASPPFQTPNNSTGMIISKPFGLYSTQTSSSVAATSSEAFLAGSTGSCPSVNNTVMMDENQIDYTLYCGADTNDDSFEGQDVDGSFMACFDICDVTPGCVVFTFVGLSSGTCYLKKSFTSLKVGLGLNYVVGVKVPDTASSYFFASSTPTTAPSTTTPSAITSATSTTQNIDYGYSTSMLSSTSSINLSSATTLSSSTSSNLTSSTTSMSTTLTNPLCATIFTDPSGSTYEVHCSSDNSADSFESINVSTGGFSSCFGHCDSAYQCAGFTYSGGDSGTCYLKQELGSYTGAASTIISCFKTTQSGGSSFSASSGMALGFSTSHPGLSSPSTIVLGSSSASTSIGNPYGSIVAPACPQSTNTICGSASSSTTCSSSSGATYQVSCGTAYTGTIIDTSSVYGKRSSHFGRATEPNYQACLNLCDSYSACVGLNYQGTDCEIYSQIDGTVPSAGNVGAVIVAPSSYAATSGSTGSTSLPGYQAQPGPTPSLQGVQYYSTASGGTVATTGGQFSKSVVTVTTSLPSSAVVTVISTTTKIGTGLPPISPSSANSVPIGYASLCYTCYLTPTVVTDAPSSSSPSPVSSSGAGTCSARRPAGTTTVFTTQIVTVCPTPLTCPARGYALQSGNGFGSGDGRGGATGVLLTTTDALGHTVTVTQVPTSTGLGSGGLGDSGVSGGSGSGTGGNSGGVGGNGFGSASGSASGGFGDSGSENSGSGTVGSGGSGSGGTTSGSGGYGASGGINSGSGSGTGNTGSSGSGATSGSGSGYGSTGSTGSYGGSGGSGTSSGTVGTGRLPTCPEADGSTFSDSMGMQYLIGCGVYSSSNTISVQNASSLALCIAACDMYNLLNFYSPSPCVSVSYFETLTAANCELKSGFTPSKRASVDSASLLTPSTGAGNPTYVSSNGTYGSGASVTVSGSGGGGTASTVTGGGGYGGIGGSGVGVTTVIGGGVTTVVGSGVITVIESGVTTAIGGGYGGSGGTGGTGGSLAGYGGYGGGEPVGTATIISNGVTIVSTYGIEGTATVISNGATVFSTYGVVPSTVYGTSTAVSTYVSNGQTVISTYGVSTVLSVVYLPASTVTTTTISVSVSVSISNLVSKVSGPTQTIVSTGPGQTVTASGEGGSDVGTVTVTNGGGGSTVTQVLTVTAYPPSSTSSFFCRTYATNYINGMHGRRGIKKRSVFDAEVVIGEAGRAPMPGSRPRMILEADAPMMTSVPT